jgi:putative transposase
VFHLDVLPSEERTVQKKGVQLFGLAYSHPRLQRWIGARDPARRRKARKFRLRYDPRDVRTVYFYDPVDEGYYPLTCSDRLVTTHYASRELSLWEWQAVKRAAQRAYRSPATRFEDRKLVVLEGQRAMDAAVASRSKSARLKRARARANREQHREFVEAAALTAEDLEVLEGLDLSAFEASYDEDDDVEWIPIPPEHENPFAGIYLEDDEDDDGGARRPSREGDEPEGGRA